MEERKIEEMKLYNDAYTTGQASFTVESRRAFLNESEAVFCERLKVISKNKRVLEIGMGTGRHCILAAQHGACSVVGIDISSSAVAVANVNAQQLGLQNVISFYEGDVESLGADLGKFDVILDHEVFSSLSWKKTLNTLCQKCLDKDGVILGIECLDNNYIFRMNRKIGYFLGKRTKWSVQNVLRYEELTEFAKKHKVIHLSSYHLFSLFFYPLIKICPNSFVGVLVKYLNLLDHKLLLTPLLQPMAFKVVFEVQVDLKQLDIE